MALRVKLPAQLSWRFGLVVLLLAALSLVIGTQAAIDVNENTRCLAAYSKRSAEVSTARAAATARKDTALAGVIDPLAGVILKVTAEGAKPATPAELRRLRAGAQEYRAAVRQLTVERAQNPLPAFPQQCSDLNQ